MNKSSRLLLAAVVAGAAMLTSVSANAFWGPFSFMRWGGWDDGWGWGGPWYGWGYPGYGWGYPGYGWGYPWYGWGYPGYGWGGWGYPYAYGWAYPYAYPAVVATTPTAPASSSAK